MLDDMPPPYDPRWTEVDSQFGSKEERRRPAVLAFAMTTAPLPLSDTPPSAGARSPTINKRSRLRDGSQIGPDQRVEMGGAASAGRSRGLRRHGPGLRVGTDAGASQSELRLDGKTARVVPSRSDAGHEIDASALGIAEETVLAGILPIHAPASVSPAAVRAGEGEVVKSPSP